MRRTTAGLLALLLLGSLSLACDTSGGYGDGDGGGGDRCADVVPGYPCGPYGNEVGRTVPNFTFYQWEDNTPVRMSDYVANVEAKRADKVFVISSFAEWCGACKLESPELYEVYTSLRDRGVELLMTLNQDADYADDPDQIVAAAERWEEQVLTMAQGDSQFLGVLADKTKYLNSFYDVNATPLNMIVDSSFRIQYKVTGWEGQEQFEAILDAIIEQDLESE